MHLQRLLPISVLLCLLVSPLLLGVWANENSSALRPNLIFILADDLGYGDLGCYGQTKIRTPNLDRLAAEGMRFTQHYSGNAVCAPSRCVLMTGLHPGHAFIRDNSETKPEGQMPIPAGTLTLARLLHQQGYVTGAFGKWGLGGPGTDGEPLNQGFDRFFGYNCQRLAHNYYPTSLWDNAERVSLNNPSFSPHDNFKPGEDPANPASYQRFQGVEYSADLIAEQALQFVRDHRHKPFFLFWPTTVPHLALQVPQDSLQEYEGRWDDPPYTGGRNYLPHYKPRAAYAAMVTRLDRDVGRLMKLVDELGLDERTVFVFTSDNGPLYGRLGGTDCNFFKSAGDLRGYKGSLYEGGIRVPCLVRWKGRIAAGGISHRVTGFEDWLPTLLELVKAKAAIPPGLDGISFVPTLLGQSQEPRPLLYREFPGYGGQQSIRLGDWKGVRQKLIPARKSQQLPQAHLELYNLADDPSEADDVSSHRPDLVAKMSRLLREQHQPSKEFPFPELDQAFRIQERHGVNWLITPRGERFFSLGVCCVNQGISRGDVNPRNPGYAAWQHYSHSNQWAEAVLKRLKSWGFNTIGGWSDYQTLKQQPDQDIRFTPVLHVGSTAGAPWWDMWHPTNIARMDGENYNFGLVDIHDSPYQELITASSAMNTETLKSRPLLKRPDASQGVPPAPRRPFADFQKPTLALKSWDRERGFIPPVSQFPMADLYVCWNKNCIYLGLYAQDVVETDLYRDKIVPEGDRSLWSVVTREISLRARIGAGRKPVLDTPAIRIDNFSGVNLHTRNIAAMELPARFFGKDRFQEGDEIELDSTFLSHARAYRTDWRGKFILRAKSVK